MSWLAMCWNSAGESIESVRQASVLGCDIFVAAKYWIPSCLAYFAVSYIWWMLYRHTTILASMRRPVWFARATPAAVLFQDVGVLVIIASVLGSWEGIETRAFLMPRSMMRPANSGVNPASVLLRERTTPAAARRRSSGARCSRTRSGSPPVMVTEKTFAERTSSTTRAAIFRSVFAVWDGRDVLWRQWLAQ